MVAEASQKECRGAPAAGHLDFDPLLSLAIGRPDPTTVYYFQHYSHF